MSSSPPSPPSTTALRCCIPCAAALAAEPLGTGKGTGHGRAACGSRALLERGALEMKNDSPTFVATFADGVVTRMTTHCESDTKLDMTRGVVLARHAYRQRTGREPVALTKAHFERDGTLLQAYSAIHMTVCG